MAHMVTPLHQVGAKVRPDKPGPSRHQHAVPLDPWLRLDLCLAVCAQGRLGVAGMDLYNKTNTVFSPVVQSCPTNSLLNKAQSTEQLSRVG